MKLSIIIPTYNEQKTIKRIVEYVQSVEYPIGYEIIIIDDASFDRTLEKSYLLKLKNTKEENKIRVYKNPVNRGKGYSIRKGISLSRGDIIIIQDADTEYDPHDIPRLIEPIVKGETRVVYGSRFLSRKKPDNMAFPNFIANKILTKLANILFGLNLTDEATCYKAFYAETLKSFDLKGDRFTFCPEVTAKLAKRKIKIRELPIDYHGRTVEEGKKIKAIDFVFAVMMLLKQRITSEKE
jgi:glycosyltransferase involved in cell wall biosynthesis